MSLSIALPKPGSLFGNITHSLESRALQLGLGLAAKVPGDPMTKALAGKFPGTVSRTSDSSWRMVDNTGRVFTARVSGTDLVVKGQDGTNTTMPIFPSQISLPGMPKLPQMPGVDLGKTLGGVVNATIGAAMRQPAIATPALRVAVRSQYPGAQVKYDGHSTWTVSNLGLEAPFQVKMKGTTVTAERNGQVLHEETMSLRRLTRW